MDEIKEQLQDLRKIQDLQCKVILLRRELPIIYKKYLQRDAQVWAKQLVNYKPNVEKPVLKIPEMEDIDFDIFKKTPRMDIDLVYEEVSNIKKCLTYLKR